MRVKRKLIALVLATILLSLPVFANAETPEDQLGTAIIEGSTEIPIDRSEEGTNIEEENDFQIESQLQNATSPELDLSSIKVSKKGPIVSIDFKILDEGSELDSVSFNFQNAKEDRKIDINESEGQLIETEEGYRISQSIHTLAPDNYKLYHALISDDDRNITKYTTETHPEIAEHKFDVVLEDLRHPDLEEIEIIGDPVATGQDFTVKLKWKSDPVDLKLDFYDWEGDGGSFYVMIPRENFDDEGNLEFSTYISEHLISGTYSLRYIETMRTTDDLYRYYGAPYDCSIEVENKEPEALGVDLSTLKVIKENKNVIITFDCANKGVGVNWGSVSLRSVDANEYGGGYIQFSESDIEETETGYRITCPLAYQPGYQLLGVTEGKFVLSTLFLFDKASVDYWYDIEENHELIITKEDLQIAGLKDLKVNGSPIKEGGEINVQFTWTGDQIEYIKMIYLMNNSGVFTEGQDFYIRIDPMDIGLNGKVDITKLIGEFHPSSDYFEFVGFDILYADGRNHYYSPDAYKHTIEIDNSKDKDVAPRFTIVDATAYKKEGRIVLDFRLDKSINIFYGEFTLHTFFSDWDFGHLWEIPLGSLEVINEKDNSYRASFDIRANFDAPGYHMLRSFYISDSNGVVKDFDLGGIRLTITKDDLKPKLPPEKYEESQIVGNTEFSINAEAGVIEDGAYFQILPILLDNDEASYNLILTSLGDGIDEFIAFDINLFKGGVKIQPNGEVTISLSIPDGFDKGNLVLYRVNEDGTKVKIEGKIVEGKYEFVVDHFSIYVLASETVEDEEPVDKEPEDKEPEDKEPVDEEPEDKEPEDKEPVDEGPEDKEPEDKDKAPKTGDNSPIALYILLLLMSTAIFVIVARNRKKAQEEQ